MPSPRTLSTPRFCWHKFSATNCTIENDCRAVFGNVNTFLLERITVFLTLEKISRRQILDYWLLQNLLDMLLFK